MGDHSRIGMDVEAVATTHTVKSQKWRNGVSIYTPETIKKSKIIFMNFVRLCLGNILAQVVLRQGKLDFQPFFTDLITLLSLFDLFRYGQYTSMLERKLSVAEIPRYFTK